MYFSVSRKPTVCSSLSLVSFKSRYYELYWMSCCAYSVANSFIVNSSLSATLSLIGFYFSQFINSCSNATSSSYAPINNSGSYYVELSADYVNTLEDVLPQCEKEFSVGLLTLAVHPSGVLGAECTAH
jgi:hypothetical protein